MKSNNKRTVFSLLTPLLIGSLLAVISLNYFDSKINPELNFEEFALGSENTSSLEFVNNIQVHCYDLNNVNKCLEGYKNSRPDEEVVLWLGNSQLHSINQMKVKDLTASHLLHRFNIDNSKYVITLSQPNANLQEHYILFEYLMEKLPIKTLVLPVVFDDMREDGIRNSLLEILKNKNIIKILNESNIGKKIYLNASDKDSTGNDLSALDGTIQEKVEIFLNTQLKSYWSIWNSREQFRGQLFTRIYFLRNSLLGINPSSVRKKIPGKYLKNFQALAAVLESAKKQKVEVLLYVVPLRNDVKIPYNIDEYKSFIEEIELLSKSSDTRFLNLENLVPSDYWGTKASTSNIGGQELDFMHFQAGGHQLLADIIYKELQKLWNGGNEYDF